MTLYQLIKRLEDVALSQPNVRTAKDGSVYDIMNADPSIEYSVFVATQGTHREDEETDYYTLTLFYIDRLTSDMESNRLQIQSVAKETLSNIIRTTCEIEDIDYETITYTPFTQRFADETAGMYATITFDCVRDYICGEAF